jgi:uncharacterized protein (DUF362 family)
VLHWAGINESIADLHAAIPPHFAIVDGIIGMEGNGPIQGRPKPAGVLVAGGDLRAVDATCCRIMGIDPRNVDYLRLTGIPERVEQRGESIDSVSQPFELLDVFRKLRL